MYFLSLKLFEVLEFIQFLMLFENQFLDTSSNFGAPFFIYIYNYCTSYTKFHNKNSTEFTCQHCFCTTNFNFYFFLLKVELNFSVQRFFAFAYKFTVYVPLLIRQKKKIRIKSFFK